MANPQQQVEKARQACRALWEALDDMESAKEKLIALGGVSFVSYLDETDEQGEPIYDISSNDMAAALVTTLDAIQSLLSANSGAHKTNLARML
jgi:prefoldin subunit 5